MSTGKVLVRRQIMEDTAAAIREKLGTTEPMRPSEFAENISLISGQSGLQIVTQDGTAAIIPSGYVLLEAELKRVNLPAKALEIR